jgi:tRNA(Arg) A34 adenosine deaminase TadA
MQNASSDPLGDLTVAWREAFLLAWESFVAGSPPVGAVIVDDRGSIVARGRSRRGENSAPRGHLASSRLSHAEINALAQIPANGEAPHNLLVTLEPCFLCTAAAAMSHVHAVRFAGPDPMWRFLAKLPDFHAVLRERWFVLDGPMPGPWGRWAALLPLLERLERNPNGARIDAFSQTDPELVAIARQIVDGRRLHAFRHRDLGEAVIEVWPALLTENNGP